MLGSGLGGLTDRVDIVDEIPYQDIPYFPVSTVEGHKGTLIFGRLNGVLSDRIQKAVVDKRNKFLHAAGQYPTKAEAEQIVEDVESYLQTILNLV